MMFNIIVNVTLVRADCLPPPSMSIFQKKYEILLKYEIFNTVRNVFLMRYVCLPPPSMSMGTPNLAKNSMQPACPSKLRLKHPRRSPDKESAPPHTTIASG